MKSKKWKKWIQQKRNRFIVEKTTGYQQGEGSEEEQDRGMELRGLNYYILNK